MNEQQRASLVKSKAFELGFDSCGITDLSPTPHTCRKFRAPWHSAMSCASRTNRRPRADVRFTVVSRGSWAPGLRDGSGRRRGRGPDQTPEAHEGPSDLQDNEARLAIVDGNHREQQGPDDMSPPH